MAAATSTPGPWRVSGDGIWAKSPWNAEVRIATIAIHSPTNGIDWKANAQLIAAAPDLRTALQMAAGALRSMEHTSLVDPSSSIRFVGDWAHFGTMTISDILDRANEALETTKESA